MSRAATFASLALLTASCSFDDRGQGAWNGPALDDGGTEGDGSGMPDGEGEEGWATAADDDHGDAASGGSSGDGHGDVDTSASDGGDDGPPPGDCPADCYCEPIDPAASLADLERGYDSSAWAETMLETLARRWPAGHDLLAWGQAEDAYFGAFTDPSSFSAVMDSLMTEAHEGTHGWDYAHAGIDTFAYFLRGDLTFEPPKIHGFPRSEIYAMVEGDSTSLYDDTYLTGDQGTYGFYELLDEGNCYINGMAAIAVVGEYIPFGISGRDGAVAFMYYLELYLERARTAHPDVYAEIKASPEYVALVKTQWLRLHFMLQHADEHEHIGIYDAEIRQLMYAPNHEAEIEMFIDHEVEASNCLP